MSATPRPKAGERPTCPECGGRMFDEGDGWFFCAASHRAVYIKLPPEGLPQEVSAPAPCRAGCPVREAAHEYLKASLQPSYVQGTGPWLDHLKAMEATLMHALAAPCASAGPEAKLQPPHPWYGGCDGFGKDGGCAECDECRDPGYVIGRLLGVIADRNERLDAAAQSRRHLRRNLDAKKGVPAGPEPSEAAIRDRALEDAALIADAHWPEAGHVPTTERIGDQAVSCAMTISVMIRRLKSTYGQKSGAPPERPKVICLCGSSRFVAEMASIAWALERDEGYIVLGLHLLPARHPGVAPDHQAEADGKKDHFDELHLRKIDLADEVLVCNIDGYIGESTRREIAYAEAHGKLVRYLEAGAPAKEEEHGNA